MLDKDDIKGLIKALQSAHESTESVAKNAVMGEKVANIERMVSEMKTATDKAHDTFVTKTEFKPVKLVVFGVVGLINLTVFGALLTLVVRSI